MSDTYFLPKQSIKKKKKKRKQADSKRSLAEWHKRNLVKTEKGKWKTKENTYMKTNSDSTPVQNGSRFGVCEVIILSPLNYDCTHSVIFQTKKNTYENKQRQHTCSKLILFPCM